MNEVKRQAVLELQKAVAAAESKATELVNSERAKMERELMSEKRRLLEEVSSSMNHQEESGEVRTQFSKTSIQLKTASDCHLTAIAIDIVFFCLFLKKSFWRTHIHFWGHWYPSFGFLVMSPLGFQSQIGLPYSHCGGERNWYWYRLGRVQMWTTAYYLDNITFHWVLWWPNFKHFNMFMWNLLRRQKTQTILSRQCMTGPSLNYSVLKSFKHSVVCDFRVVT